MNDSEDNNDNRGRLTFRGLAIWLVLIVSEIVHGILRAIALVPFVGEFRSNQIGVFTGSAIIVVVAYVTIRWIGARQAFELLLVGSVWLACTVAFEVLFGRFVAGLAWERIASDYNVLKGGLMPFGLLVLFFSPMIASKLQASKEKRIR